MKTIRITYISLFLLLSLLVSSCGAKDTSVDVAVIVALTQTAAALQSPVAPATQPPVDTPTQSPVVEPTQLPATEATQEPVVVQTQQIVAASNYQPLNSDMCNALNNDLSASTGYSGAVTSPVPFEDFVAKQTGSGCQIVISQTGEHISSLDLLITPATSTMLSSGWTDVTNQYGSAGPGAMGMAFRKDSTLCLASFQMEEINPALCPGNEPVTMCWDRLAPEEMKYSATFNCATLAP